MQLIQNASDPGGSAGAVKFGTIEGTLSDGTISGVTFADEDNMVK